MRQPVGAACSTKSRRLPQVELILFNYARKTLALESWNRSLKLQCKLFEKVGIPVSKRHELGCSSTRVWMLRSHLGLTESIYVPMTFPSKTCGKFGNRLEI